MPEHEYVDLKITYKPNDDDWYVSLYGKNLNDDTFIGTWAAAVRFKVALNLRPIQILLHGESCLELNSR